ncbi:MAG: hypothetical protein HUT38_01620, partial [Candidatus Paceibacter sp.]|nr:hypothetical protein [Candidatus Paceibacter sp.]
MERTRNKSGKNQQKQSKFINSGFLMTVFLFSFLSFFFNLRSASADLAAGLVSYWKLDETSGTTAFDS